MDAGADGERAAERVFTPRRPTSAVLSGRAGMDVLAWFARTSAVPAAFRLDVRFVLFERVALFRLAHSRAVLDRTAAHVAAVSVGSVFYMVSAGAATLSQGGRDIPLAAGSCAIASGDAPHQLRIPEGAETILVVVRKGVFATRGLGGHGATPRRFPDSSLTDATSVFLQALASDLPVPTTREGVASQQAILSLLTGLIVGTSVEPLRATQREQWIASALTFIAANYSNADLTTADVATAAGISSRHLQRLFASADTSVADELRRTRVQWASVWLAEERKRRLVEIATASGFGTVSRMSRAFRRQLGVSPVQYRSNPAIGRL
jgi:AraC-like DNA-binding protein